MSTEPKTSIDTSAVTPELLAALVEAQRSVVTIGKDGRNTQRNYAYATSEAMIRAGREHLNGAGLAFLHTFVEGPPGEPAGNIGNQHVAALVRIPWVLGHASGGMIRGEAVMAAIGSPARPNDKAVAATVTYALGFVLRGLLLIDKAEEDSHSVDQRQEVKGDPLWEAYEVARAVLAKDKSLALEQAHTMARESAGVTYDNEPTDDQVRAMTLAARKLLAAKAPPAPSSKATEPPPIKTEPPSQNARDEWRAAASALLEEKIADFRDAEGEDPKGEQVKAMKVAITLLSAKAIGLSKWPARPKETQYIDAKQALIDATERMKAGL